MLAEILGSLSGWLYESYPIALGASFLWGLASMLLSPCHLISVPLVMGYLAEDSGGKGRSGDFRLALLFALGMTVSIGMIGLATSIMGRIIGDIGATGTVILALVLIYMGVSLSGIVDLPLPGAGKSGYRRKGLSGAIVMGLVLGAALGPCTFAFMAPVLALMFQLSSERLAQAVTLGVMFAIGHGLVVVFAGSFTGKVKALLAWSGSSRGARIFRIICGCLVVLGGIYMILTAVHG